MRYLVFVGYAYYPSPGAYDLCHRTDDLDEAVGIAKDVDNSEQWSHVYDNEAGRIVYEVESIPLIDQIRMMRAGRQK